MWPHNEVMVNLWCHKRLWRVSRHHKYNVPIIVCGSVAERGLDEKRGATPATRDVIFLMCYVSSSWGRVITLICNDFFSFSSQGRRLTTLKAEALRLHVVVQQ